MAEKTNANIGFEKQIWDAACVLWGHIPAAEYRKVIVGLCGEFNNIAFVLLVKTFLIFFAESLYPLFSSQSTITGTPSANLINSV